MDESQTKNLQTAEGKTPEGNDISCVLCLRAPQVHPIFLLADIGQLLVVVAQSHAKRYIFLNLAAATDRNHRAGPAVSEAHDVQGSLVPPVEHQHHQHVPQLVAGTQVVELAYGRRQGKMCVFVCVCSCTIKKKLFR